MRLESILWSLTWLTALCGARPSKAKRSTDEVAVYWGFGTERNLSAYCAPGQGIDILIIGSVSSLNDSQYPTGIFGAHCIVEPDGSFTAGCAGVAQDIQTCQAAGIKIFTGYSSDGTKWSLAGANGASDVAATLWQMYGGDLSDTSVPRPFGNVKVDGFDFDIESNPHNESLAYLGDLVNDVRGYFADDTSKSYYISGAPECGLPERNMGAGMMEAQFDYLWIQFYNNACSAADLTKNPKKNPDGVGQYNLDKWPAYLAGGASSKAALFVGLAASLHAGDTFDYTPAQNLTKIIAASPEAAGVMLWNTAHSDASVYHGCTYAQNVAHVLSTGQTCPAP